MTQRRGPTTLCAAVTERCAGGQRPGSTRAACAKGRLADMSRNRRCPLGAGGVNPPSRPLVDQKGRPMPGKYGITGSAPTLSGTRGEVPVSNGDGAVEPVLLVTTLSVELGVVAGAALAMGARPIAPPIAAAASHGAMYLMVVFMVLSSELPGPRRWLCADHCFPANRCR